MKRRHKKDKWALEREAKDKARKSERKRLSTLLKKAEAAVQALSEALINRDGFKQINIDDKAITHSVEACNRVRIVRAVVRL